MQTGRRGKPPSHCSTRLDPLSGTMSFCTDSTYWTVPSSEHLLLDGLPTAASSHSDSGLACNIVAFWPLSSVRCILATR